MTKLGKLRRGRRRLICRITGHDWGGWEPLLHISQGMFGPYLDVNHLGVFNVGPVEEYRECQRCPKTEWRRP